MSQHHTSTSICQDLSRWPAAGDDRPRPSLSYGPLSTHQTPPILRPLELSPPPSEAMFDLLRSLAALGVHCHHCWNQAQIAITACWHRPPFTTRDFVPGRFSDVEQPSRIQASPTSEKPAPMLTPFQSDRALSGC